MSKALPIVYLAGHGETAWTLSAQHKCRSVIKNGSGEALGRVAHPEQSRQFDTHCRGIGVTSARSRAATLREHVIITLLVIPASALFWHMHCAGLFV
jgi:hypothetical protein